MNSRSSILILIIITLSISTSSAQRFRQRNFDPGENLVIGVGGGLAKYFGEFTDQYADAEMSFVLKYFIVPELSVGMNGGFGNLVYNRRVKEKFRDSYFMQFNPDPVFLGAASSSDPIMQRERLRFTSISFAELRFFLNMLPRTRFNPYLSFGVGVLHYSNDDENEKRAAVRLNRQQYLLKNPGNAALYYGFFNSDLQENLNTLVAIPVGIGADIRINQNIAVFFDLSYRFLIGRGKDYLDAFGKEVLENFAQHIPGYTFSADESSDSYATLTLGVEFFLPLGQPKLGRR